MLFNRPAMLCALVLAATAPPARSAVTLQGTRIVHDAAKGRDVAIAARNVGTLPAMTQIWIDDGDSAARPENVRTPFRLTPAEPRLLRPEQGQTYRITYAPRPSDPALPTDRESVFYFNLLDIPPRPQTQSDENVLQFAVRSRLKLFHRPAGLHGSARDAAGLLQWRRAGQAMRLLNPTPYHVTLSTLSLPGGQTLDIDMIAPFSEVTLTLPPGATVPDTLPFRWLDDHGTPRDAVATLGR